MNTRISSPKPLQKPAHEDKRKDSYFRRDHERRRNELDLDVRRVALYGAMALAGLMYLAGICIAVGMLVAVSSEMALMQVDIVAAVEASWHLVVAALASLFSVPTVLAIAVIRSVGTMLKDPGADTVHGAISERAADLVEKMVSARSGT